MTVRSLVAAACVATLVPLAAAEAGHYKVLHDFTGATGDGLIPISGLLAGPRGTFYGTTAAGGVGCEEHRIHGCGTVYSVAQDGTQSVFYAFQGGTDGRDPSSGVIADAAGNLYGVTFSGGSEGCADRVGCGTVYRIARDGTETQLHVFDSFVHGAYPSGNLIADAAGNLYGVTTRGGLKRGEGNGTVFRIAPDGTHTMLYAFLNKNDGADPVGPLAMDGDGNLYGTTALGGTSGEGVVFKLAPDGTQTVLHSFGGTGDGNGPLTGAIIGPDGNLYGATVNGGALGEGAIFKVTQGGTESILYSFTGGSHGGTDGSIPYATPIFDGDGNLYGTTWRGGGVVCAYGCGTVYKIAPDGTETVLHAFRKQKGAFPMTGVTLDRRGDIFGTTQQGGTLRAGVVFKIHR